MISTAISCHGIGRMLLILRITKRACGGRLIVPWGGCGNGCHPLCREDYKGRRMTSMDCWHWSLVTRKRGDSGARPVGRETSINESVFQLSRSAAGDNACTAPHVSHQGKARWRLQRGTGIGPKIPTSLEYRRDPYRPLRTLVESSQLEHLR
jgi:hypothetical protein